VDDFGDALLSISGNQHAASPAAEGCEGDKEKEPPVPPAVEDVGDCHDEKVLPFHVAVEHEPVQQEHDG